MMHGRYVRPRFRAIVTTNTAGTGDATGESVIPVPRDPGKSDAKFILHREQARALGMPHQGDREIERRKRQAERQAKKAQTKAKQ
jgi:hypothetical protein